MGSGTGNFFKVVLKNFDVLAGYLSDSLYSFFSFAFSKEKKSHDGELVC